MRLRTLSLLGILAFLLTACSEDESEPTGPVRVGDPATMVLETSRQFVADFPGVDSAEVFWKVSISPEYAKVTTDGLVTVGSSPVAFFVIAVPPDESGFAPDTSAVTVVSLRPAAPVGFGAYSVATSVDGKVAGVDGLDTLWIREGSTTRAAYFPGWPVSVAFSPSGNELYIACLTGKVIQINVSTLTAVDTVELGNEALHLKVRSSDGMVFATDLGGWLHRIDPSSMTKVGAVQFANPSSALAFAPGSTTLWVATTEDGKVYKVNSATMLVLDDFTLGNGTQRLVVAPSGDSVYVAHQTKDSLFIIRPSTRAVTAVPVCCGPQGVAVSNDGQRLYVAQVGAAVAELDRRTLSVIGATATGSTTRDVMTMPGSKSIYAAGEVGAVKIELNNAPGGLVFELTEPRRGHDRTATLRRLTWLLDDAIRLPFGIRIGLDALIGLVPGLGDLAGGAAALYGLSVAWSLGAPPIVLTRMVVNAAVDALVGAIPLLGDLWDVGFASHRRNLAILEQWLALPHKAERRSRWVLIGLASSLVVALLASFALAIWLVIWLVQTLAVSN